MPLKYCLREPHPVPLAHNIFIAVLIENICIQHNPSTLEVSTGSVQGYLYGEREDRNKVDSVDPISESPNTSHICTYTIRKNLLIVFWFICFLLRWANLKLFIFQSQLLKLRAQTSITSSAACIYFLHYSLWMTFNFVLSQSAWFLIIGKNILWVFIQYNELWSHPFPISHLQLPQPLNHPHDLYVSFSLSHDVQVVRLICSWV